MKFYNRRRQMCEWDDLDAFRDHFQRLLQQREITGISPFSLLTMPGISAEEHRIYAERCMADRLNNSRTSRAESASRFLSDKLARQKQPEDASISGGASKPKIRLGYLSCDFHEHATMLLLIEVLEAHDRERFQLIAYSYGPDDGLSLRRRLEKTCDEFIDIQSQTIAQAAETIHSHGIDILIDLKGFTSGSRTEILTYRPAPIQVNYLGFPGTLGGELCDYIITDHYITPPQSATDYSESFAYLPNSYQPHSRHSPIAATPSRSQANLPETGFVFCCFNQSYKITPDIFDVWCQLLAHCPGSVLWLLHDPMAEGNLRSQAMQRGVLPNRLIFANHVGQAEHLGRLPLADLVLDTLPYNAHTTASDALWAGVPIVTCSGDTFASRVAGSLLLAIDLPELITTNLADYYQLALKLATNPKALLVLKEKLAQQRLTTPLFDVINYTLDLENLYEQMWAIHLSGKRPPEIFTHQQ